MTHFANADGADGADSAASVAQVLACFAQASADLGGERSVANSAALMRHGSDAAVRADWVRSGIALYGGAADHPAHDSAHWNLRPAMTLRSRVLATQSLQAGERVGYGGSFVADAAMRIGVVACGYADGYPRHARTGTPVLVDGQRTRVVGRVSMDMITVDLGALPGAGVGSDVTLWGQGPGAAVLPIDEVAHSAGTVGYELMCALAARVPVHVAPMTETL